MKRMWTGLLAAAFVAGFAGTASAQLNIAELAAGVAIPFATSTDGLSTEAVITNGASTAKVLHFDLLNGDPLEDWEVQSWNCELTARETVQISFANDSAGGSDVTFECDDVEGQAGAPYAGNDGSIDSTAEQGVLWVTVQNVAKQTVGDNVLFADFTLVDTGNDSVASAPAAGFQGGTGNDGDHKYDFNTTEYSKFPAALATNYLPPATYAGRLLVFTLDGIPGLAPKARGRVLWYNDDEDYEDASFTFKCMDFLDYAAIATGLDELTTAGHMEIIPVFEPSESERKVPFLCYNIQDGALDAGTAMRPCAQSTSAFDRTPDPSLDTQL